MSAATPELWMRFVTALTESGGQLLTGSDLRELPMPILIEPDARMFLPDWEWDLTADPWVAATAVTLADVAVAESGTIICHAGPNRARLASLTCEFHVVLVTTSRLVATLEDAARMSARSAVWITGPSRTADIEGQLVRGVHGPGKLGVYHAGP
jgi:L-lactate utilization protein LutC